jgi:hypothetical protein
VKEYSGGKMKKSDKKGKDIKKKNQALARARCRRRRRRRRLI